MAHRDAKITGRLVLLDPLPRPVRLRLWLTGQIDHAACSLIVHRRFRTAVALWRVTGLWR